MSEIRGSRRPLVSIGLPVYNAGTTLKNLIENLCDQDYDNIEIIISDNNSLDNTADLAREFAAKYKNIYFHKFTRNEGAIVNFNKVFELSHGEYFIWMAQDDTKPHNYISSLLHVIIENPNAALCIPNVIGTYGEKKEPMWQFRADVATWPSEINRRFLQTVKNFPAVGFYGLYRSKFVRESGPIPKIVGGDLLFIQKLSIFGEFIFTGTTVMLYHQRDNWNSQQDDHIVYLGENRRKKIVPLRIVHLFYLLSLVVTFAKRNQLNKRIIIDISLIKLKEIVINLYLKFIKYLTNEKFFRHTKEQIYWKWIHLPTIDIYDPIAYRRRIILHNVSD